MRIRKDVLRWVSPSLHEQFKESVNQRDWDGALSYTNSENRISLCLDLMLAKIIDFDDEEAPYLLASSISGGDLPRRELDALHALLSRYLREGKRAFDGEAARQAFKRLPKKVTIHRGTVEDEDRYGVCWTLSRDTAVFFATKHGRFRVTDSKPVILSATVNRDDIFALLFERNEQEVLISPESLDSVVTSDP